MKINFPRIMLITVLIWLFAPPVLFGLFALSMYVRGCTDAKIDYAERAFREVEINFENPEPIFRENSYRVYALTESEIENFLERKFETYKNWKPFDSNRSIGINAIYSMSGERDDILVAYKKFKGSDPPWNTIAMYINKTKGHLILHYGITYGR